MEDTSKPVELKIFGSAGLLMSRILSGVLTDRDGPSPGEAADSGRNY